VEGTSIIALCRSSSLSVLFRCVQILIITSKAVSLSF
jgi:hypothetical protein